MIDVFRVSKREREQLQTLKRRTGIANFNVLCRWAFCVSLAEVTVPRPEQIPADGNLEITWRTFAGAHEEVYTALLRQRCHADGLPTDRATLEGQFRLHLHRGIAYLHGDPAARTLPALLRKALV